MLLGLGSIVETSGSIVETSGSIVETSGSLVETSGLLVETSGLLVETSGSLVVELDSSKALTELMFEMHKARKRLKSTNDAVLILKAMVRQIEKEN